MNSLIAFALPDLKFLASALGAVAFASLLSGCAVLLVLALRILFGRWLAPGWRCLLWLPVAILCILPRLPDMGLSLDEASPAPEPRVLTTIAPSPFFHPIEMRSRESSTSLEPAPREHHLTLPELLALAWIAVGLVILSIWLTGYALLRHRMSRGAQPVPDSLAELFHRSCETMNLRRIPKLLVTSSIDSPAVAGFLRPVVMLPASLAKTLDDKELNYVLLHEAGHVKRGDLVWHWFSAMLVAVHWFNPLLWLAARLFRADREAACDAAVLATCRMDARQTYGDTLLKLQSSVGCLRYARSMVGVLGGVDMLRRRILDIANFGRSSRAAGWSCASLMMLLAAGIVGIAAEPAENPAAPDPFGAKANQRGTGSAAIAQLSSREAALRRIDVLAGAADRQIYISSKVVLSDGNIPDDLEWLSPAKALGQTQTPAPAGSPDQTAKQPPNAMTLTGVLTDPQFQVVMRALAQKKDLNLIVLPSVSTHSGQKATVELVREMRYPTEFDPPQVAKPDQSKAPGNDSPFPVTPTTPTAFETRPIGLQLNATPALRPDGYTLDLALNPEFTSFEGFINYGSPIQTTAKDALGNPTTVTLTENKILQPVFSFNKVTTSVTIWDGQTVVLGGQINVPASFLGDGKDLPDAKKAKSRTMLLFVTAKIIDPSGRAKTNANGMLEPPPRGIILKEVDISGMKLDAALNLVSELCKKADARPGSPGINIMLRHPNTEPPVMSLHMQHVKVSELLDQFAEAAGLDLQVERNTVLLVPKAK